MEEKINELSIDPEKVKELQEITWAYRVFSIKSKGEVKYGLKRVFLNKDGDIIDWDKKFVLNPVFSSSLELKMGLKTFLEDLSTREGKKILNNSALNKAYKCKRKELGEDAEISLNVDQDVFGY